MKKASKILAVLLVLAIVILAMTACSNTPTTASPAAPASSAQAQSSAASAAAPAAAAPGTLQSKIDPKDVYYVVCAFDQLEFFNAHKMAWDLAGKMFNVQTKWVGIPGGDVTQFVNLLETTIAKKPAGLVVFGLDESLKPSIDKAVAQGIPTMTWESDILSSNRDTWIGSNGHDLGYTGGKLYADYIKGQGKIAILTMPGLEMYDNRAQGYKDAFKNYPGIQVVAEGDTKTDEAVAVQAAKDILTAHPDLTGFVCTDATGPMGAVTAISEAGLTGKVQVLGLDRDTALLQRIKSGEVFGAIVQDDAPMLQWALFNLIMGKYNGDVLLTTDNKAAKARVLPNTLNMSINLITKDNVDYYMAANEKYAEYVKTIK